MSGACPDQSLLRYARLIAGLLGSAPEPRWPAENALTVQVERGAVFASLLINKAASADTWVEQLVAVSERGDLPRVAVVDVLGHRRPMYVGMLIYGWLRASQMLKPQARWAASQRSWSQMLARQLQTYEMPAPLPAELGASAVGAAWAALALSITAPVGRSACSQLAGDFFQNLAASQQPDGELLRAGASDNPETRWYHELVLLHALASYAIDQHDSRLWKVVQRCGEFHLHQTQPDHASGQPWAINAFLLNPTTRPLADQALHAAQALRQGAWSSVSLMLLADCLYCLKNFSPDIAAT